MKKTYFVADAHLGSRFIQGRAQLAATFVKWIESVRDDAECIYMLGDIFDFWFEFPCEYPRCYDDVLHAMKMTTEKGVKIEFFAGNHDQWSWGELEALTGATFHPAGERVEIQGKQFFLAHGHGLGKQTCRERITNIAFESRFCRSLLRYLCPPSLAFTIAFGWSKKNRIKHSECALNNTIDYYSNNAGSTYYDYPLVEAAKDILEKNNDEIVVFGHLHKEVNLMLGNGKQIVVLGAFFDDRAYAVFDGETIWCENFDV